MTTSAEREVAAAGGRADASSACAPPPAKDELGLRSEAAAAGARRADDVGEAVA